MGNDETPLKEIGEGHRTKKLTLYGQIVTFLLRYKHMFNVLHFFTYHWFRLHDYFICTNHLFLQTLIYYWLLKQKSCHNALIHLAANNLNDIHTQTTFAQRYGKNPMVVIRKKGHGV